MKRSRWLIASLALCLLAYASRDALAFSSVRNSWKTYYPTACSTLVSAADACTLCHSNPNVNPVIYNAYGDALVAANRSVSAVDGQDSDGDGRTNHQEIVQDCSFPGSMASPADQPAWGTLKAIYR